MLTSNGMECLIFRGDHVDKTEENKNVTNITNLLTASAKDYIQTFKVNNNKYNLYIYKINNHK